MWSHFERVAQQHAARVAMTSESSHATYASLLRGVAALGPLFSGARHPVVLIAMPSGPEMTIVELAVFRAEGVAVPVPDKMTEREARSIFDLVVPDLVVVSSLVEQAPIVRALTEPSTILTFEGAAPPYDGVHRVVRFDDLDDAAPSIATRDSGLPSDARMLQLTSGSTGRPKAIVLSNDALLANLDANRAHLAAFEGQHVWSPMPQFHAMGGAVVMEHLWHGSPVHVANRFLPGEDLARMRRNGCTAIVSSPMYLKLMLRLGVLRREKLPDLQSFTIGSAGIEPQLVADLLAAYPDAVVHCRYGLSESVGALTRLSLRAGDAYEAGLVGSLVGDAVYADALLSNATNDVEIVVRSRRNAIGQLVGPGEHVPVVDEDGFLHTGDVGRVDDLGRLTVCGRMSSFLKVNGHRVSPFEIELALKSIEGVHEAVVVGTPDALSGQRIVACLEALPSRTLPDAAELDRLCRKELATHKVPQRFVVFAMLPRTHAGKPDRNAILTEVAR